MDFAQFKDTFGAIANRLIRLDFAGLRRLIMVNGIFDDDKIVANFTHMDRLAHSIQFKTHTDRPSPFTNHPVAFDGAYQFGTQSLRLDAYKRDRKLTGLLILRDQQIIHEDYLKGTTPSDLRISWSMSKSIIALLLGRLMDKGLLPDHCLDYVLSDYLPKLRGTGYDGVTLRQVMMMASGVRFNEDYHDYHSDINRMGRVLAIGGGLDDFAASLTREYPPGRYLHYVSIDTHVIGMMIRVLCGKDIAALLRDHILMPLRLESDCNILTDTQGQPFILGGLNMTLRDYARLGAMVLNGGQWDGDQIVPASWLAQITRAQNPPHHPDNADTPLGRLGYGMQWWCPPDAHKGEVYCAGIYGQYLYLYPPTHTLIVQTAVDRDFDAGDSQMALDTLVYFRQLAQITTP